MGAELYTLVRGDHDDIDAALGAMVDPAMPPKELTHLVDMFRLALAVHTAAEAHVIPLLLTRVSHPRALGMLALHSRMEHSAQHAAADAMLRIRPGTLRWYKHALGLRELLLDHAARAERARCAFAEHVPAHVGTVLASEYAAERLRVLASTSPLVVAQRRHWATSLH